MSVSSACFGKCSRTSSTTWLREVGAAVVHRQQDRRDRELRVEVPLDQLDVVEQLAEALERVVLALDRDEHLARGDERVDREQPERRRAVDEDVVEVLLELAEVGVERGAQPLLARDERDELDLRAGEVDRRRHAPQPGELRAALDDVAHGRVVDDDVVDARRLRPVLDAERGRCVALRVEVDDQHARARLGQGRGEVHRGRGLADAALLVRDGEDAGALRQREDLFGEGRAGAGRCRRPRARAGSSRRRCSPAGVLLAMFHVKQCEVGGADQSPTVARKTRVASGTIPSPRITISTSRQSSLRGPLSRPSPAPPPHVRPS